jgi:hypothetical protein
VWLCGCVVVSLCGVSFLPHNHTPKNAILCGNKFVSLCCF